jgi:hypothetical protein
MSGSIPDVPKSLEDIIQKDFDIQDKNSLNYLNHKFYEDEPEFFFDMKPLMLRKQ